MGGAQPGDVVLVVEDQPGDIQLFEEAFSEVAPGVELFVVTDGVEAFDFFHGRDEYAGTPRADIVLLDLDMPNKNGRQVLTEMNEDEELSLLPTIVVSNTDDPDVIGDSYRRGATAYVTKPEDYEGMVELLSVLCDFWLEKVELPPR